MAKKEQATTETREPVEYRLVRTKELARLYGLTPEYMRRLRHLRQGPPYLRRGKIVLYELPVFDDWFWRDCKSVEPDPSL
jgi:hypothetical protein